MTSCYFCKGPISENMTAVDFWWGDTLKIIEQVPTQVCEQCGEKYFQANVYKAMERLAQESTTFTKRITVDVVEYSPV